MGKERSRSLYLSKSEFVIWNQGNKKRGLDVV